MNASASPLDRSNANRGAGSLASQWAALHDAAEAVSVLAGVAPEQQSSAIRRFPVTIREAGPVHQKLAEQGISDIAAIMQPGLSALLAVKARGLDATTAALTLWQEFRAARDAVLALAPEAGELGPRRSA